MLSKNQKRLIIIIIALAVSIFIWYVNASWRNSFWICLILSTTTFLIIYTPFEIYFSWRDIWYDRWDALYLKELKTSKVKINIDGGFLTADLIISKELEVVNARNTIVIVSPGFSDTKETLQYMYYPLAYQGYIILAYDARGIGESKKTGKRNELIKRIEDFNSISKWIKTQQNYKMFKIYCLGVSIGAITVLCGGFHNKEFEKIVAISSISKYRENILASKGIVKLSYRLKGINLTPNETENKKLSPYIIIRNLKAKITSEEWKKLSSRVFLMHARNDKVIPFKNFEDNRDILELSPENQLIMEIGGHMLKKDEHAIVGATLRFFNKQLY